MKSSYSLQNIDPQRLQAFFKAFPGDISFLQSLGWRDFQQKLGQEAFSMGIFTSSDVLVGLATVFQTKSRRGTFWHVPHGPLILKKHEKEAFKAFLDWYKAFGREKKVDYVRVSPLMPQNTGKPLQDCGFKPSVPYMVNPERTLTLDLQNLDTEEKMLTQMKKTTRYEVRQGLKKGIEVKMGNGEADFGAFWGLHEQTFARQRFNPFAKAKTETQLAVLGENCQIFTAYVDQKPFASSLIVFDDHAGYYHQGASVRSKLPVAAATLWAAIKEAQKRGLKRFNFWGLSEKENKSHPWYGLSRFKRGFGGTETEYVHAHEFGLTWRHVLARGVEKIRRWKKKY